MPVYKSLQLLWISAFGYLFGVSIFAMPYFVIALPALFLLSLNAVAAVTFWLVSEICFGNYQILGANPRTIIALVIGSIFLLREIISYKGTNLRRTLDFLKIPLLLVALGVITNIYSGAKFYEYTRWLVTISSNLMIVLLMGFGIRNIRQFKNVIFIFLIIVTVDSGIGILQYLGVQEAYGIREFLAKSQIYSPAGRILGLSRNIIEFSYILLLGFFMFAGNLFGKPKKFKLFMELGLIVVTITLFINATRSAMGGVFFALIGYLILHRKIFHEKILSRLKIVLVLCAMGLLFFVAYFTFQTSGNTNFFSKKWFLLQDTSALGRLSRFHLAYDVSMDHPFGIGTVNYDKYLYEYWTKQPAMRGISLEEFSVHNNFLRTTLEHGFLGGILLIVFLLTLFRKTISLIRITKDIYMKNILLGIFYFFFAYIFNIFFHNFGPMYGDNIFWFLIGLLACATNIIYQEKKEAGINA